MLLASVCYNNKCEIPYNVSGKSLELQNTKVVWKHATGRGNDLVYGNSV